LEQIEIWLLLATFCAFFIKGLSGFANTLVFTSILSFTTNNIYISPVELLVGFPSNIIVAWKERKQIDWKICASLSLLVILGSLPGIFLLKNVDAKIIKIIFGIIVIGIGVEMLLRESVKKSGKESKILRIGIGICSGILCGMYGIGALLAAYLTRVSDNSKAFKANICMVFLVENIFRIASYSIAGIITWNACKISVLLLPVMLVGLFCGMKSSSVLNEKIAKKIVIMILIISGISLVVFNLK
jgi:uncharacterized membrane protein YfcA